MIRAARVTALVIVAGASASALFVGCGSRTGLFVSDDAGSSLGDASGGSSGSRSGSSSGSGALFWHRSITLASGGGQQQESLDVAATFVLGYRYLPRDGGFNFGVGFTPMIGDGGFFPYFLPWGGISLGGGF